MESRLKTSRRGILAFLGIAPLLPALAAAAPAAEAVAALPLTAGLTLQQWSDEFFIEYVRSANFVAVYRV